MKTANMGSLPASVRFVSCISLFDRARPLTDNPHTGRCCWFEHGTTSVPEQADDREPDSLRRFGQLLGAIETLASLVLTVPA